MINRRHIAVAAVSAATFVATAVMGTPQAEAQKAPVCRGENILERLKADQPEVFARLKAKADKTINADAIFWKLEKDGQAPSYLLGTMHSSDARITTLKPAVEKAFSNAKAVILELNTFDIAETQNAMQQFVSRLLQPASQPLDTLLDQRELDLLNTELPKRGIPSAMTQKFQPWFLATALSLPICEVMRTGANKLPFLDKSLAERATAKGIPVIGLETVVEQLDALSSMPMDVQVAQLKRTLALVPEIDNSFETITQMYLNRQMGFMLPLSVHMLGGDADAEAIMKVFEDNLIDRRNKLMLERALPHMIKGNVFIAVGAGHLFGKTGLVAGFRSKGYKVTAVD